MSFPSQSSVRVGYTYIFRILLLLWVTKDKVTGSNDTLKDNPLDMGVEIKLRKRPSTKKFVYISSLLFFRFHLKSI